MTTSGTFAWAPSAADLTLNAFARIQLRGTQITQEHLSVAAMEANLLQVELSNRQPNLWTRETYSQVLTESDADYTLPARAVAFMAVYMTTTSGSTSTDTLLTPLSAYDYASISDKTEEGPPTSYWYDRQSTPIITLWPVPDDAATYTLKISMLTQPEDVNLPSGVTLDMPYRWLDYFSKALSARLAAIYKPELEAKRDADAERAWMIAAGEDNEAPAPLRISPIMSGYFR